MGVWGGCGGVWDGEGASARDGETWHSTRVREPHACDPSRNPCILLSFHAHPPRLSSRPPQQPWALAYAPELCSFAPLPLPCFAPGALLCPEFM